MVLNEYSVLQYFYIFVQQLPEIPAPDRDRAPASFIVAKEKTSFVRKQESADEAGTYRKQRRFSVSPQKELHSRFIQHIRAVAKQNMEYIVPFCFGNRRYLLLPVKNAQRMPQAAGSELQKILRLQVPGYTLAVEKRM